MRERSIIALLASLMFSSIVIVIHFSPERWRLLVCRLTVECSYCADGVVIGGSQHERLFALHEIRYAAETYQKWTATRAPFGILSLRDSRPPSMIVPVASSWSLVFDPITPAAKSGDGSVYSKVRQPAAIGARPALDTNKAHNRPRQIFLGAISHEICHQYVAILAGSLSTPDLIDEAAAISCETPAARLDQLSDFSISKNLQYNHGVGDTFQYPHPIKHMKQSLTVAAALRGSLRTTEIAIDEHSAAGGSLVFFYGRAAMLQQFLRERSCFRGRVIGALIKGVSVMDSFDLWLHQYGPRYCLPVTVKAFQESLFNFAARFVQNHPKAITTPARIF